MNKLLKLKHILKKLDSVVIAYSGGVDSSFLLKVLIGTLPKKNILAVTAISPTYTKSELEDAKKFTKDLSVRYKLLYTNEFKDKNFINNPKDRCYYCKKELFKKLKEIAKKQNFKYVIDASNFDDKKDYRPGSIAKKEYKVKSPLQEAGFTKKDIRIYSKKMKLSSWDKPSLACLSSRIPYGEKITKSVLRRIERGEKFIKNLGVKNVRVRCHNKVIARIEVDKKDIKTLLNKRNCGKITKYLKNQGFKYVTVDLEGYRVGSLNEVL